MMNRLTRTIPVMLSHTAYDVVVGYGVLGDVGARVRKRLPGARRAMIVADANLPGATVDRARESLRAAGLDVSECVVEASEPRKSLATLEHVLVSATRSRLEREEPIVALGGGIVGDVAGFAAAVYRRGVPVVQCPTTLLSMVDASVGGKTGVNLTMPGGGADGAQGVLKKNMIGAFHQPVLVVCDVQSLESLPGREFRSGLAECIKHSLFASDWNEVGGAGLFEWMYANLVAAMNGDFEARIELVARNVALKAKVVAADEREEREDNRGRMVLNMGHTVGHAIEPLACKGVMVDAGGRETEASEGGLLHGEAVGLGLIAESVIAERAGVAATGTSEQVIELCRGAGLPTRVAGLPENGVLIDTMRDDKKVKFGSIRFAVPTGGQGEAACVILRDAGESAVAAGLDAIRAKMV